MLNTEGEEGRAGQAGQDSLPPAWRPKNAYGPWVRSSHLFMVVFSPVLVIHS